MASSSRKPEKVSRADDADAAADFEVRAGWSGKVVNRSSHAVVTTATHGQIDHADELTERDRSLHGGTRWRLRAWLQGLVR